MKFLLCCLLFILLGGCAAKGPQFTKLLSPPDGQSIIYVYRTWTYNGGANRYQIVLNDKKMTPMLSNQSYLSFFIQPGKQKIHLESFDIDSVLEFNAESNKTYFIRIMEKDYIMVRVHIPTLVDRNLAMLQMEKCGLAL